MPELPEVEALARFLDAQVSGSRVASVTLASLSALKTVEPSLSCLAGELVAGVRRRGKFLDLQTASGVHLVWHLSRAGWVRWNPDLPTAPVRPGKGPLALRMAFVSVDGEPLGGMDITEQGTQKRLALYVVRDPSQVPGVARLGPDALSLTRADLAGILAAAGRAQVKGVLRDQSLIAGIGNAYSDEILHRARMSPFQPCGSLDEDQIDRLHESLHGILASALDAAVGQGTGTLKSEKRSGLAVHGRAGQACPVCGDTVHRVSFADSSLEYCPACQTKGQVLADRRMSRLLK